MPFQFGILSKVDSDVASIAFVGTILFLILFENFTRIAENALKGSVIYNQMLQKIYKELMIMGFVSFTVAMYQATKHPSETDSWFTAIDFVGYVLFFLATFIVAHSLYIMMVSMMTSKTYSRLHAMSLADTLELCDRAQETWLSWYLFTMRLLPFSPQRTVIEFKIIYALFRNTYWLPGSFDYGAYLSGCLARYSLKLINVQNSSWVIMVLLCGANYIRLNYLGNEFGNCRDFKYVEEKQESEDFSSPQHIGEGLEWSVYVAVGRELRQVSNKCTKQHLKLFFFCGFFICVYALALYFVGKFYEEHIDLNLFNSICKSTYIAVYMSILFSTWFRVLTLMSLYARLMARAGVVSTDDYEEFLIFVEANHLKADEERLADVKIPRRYNKKKPNIIQTVAKNMKKSVRSGGLGQSFRDLQNKTKKTKMKIWIGGNTNRIREGLPAAPMQSTGVTDNRNPRQLIFRPSLGSDEYLKNDAVSDTTIRHSPSETSPVNGRRRSSISAVIGKMVKTVRPKPLQSNESTVIGGIGRLDKNPKGNFGMSFFKRAHNNEISTDDADVKLSEDLSSIFLFNSPELFFRAVEIAIMLNSLYLSLWISNFVTAVERALPHSWLWQILMLVPLVLVIPLIGETVKIASVISAIAELNVDVIGTIVEEEEKNQNLCNELREKVLRRLRGAVGDQKQVLRCLFNEIDSDMSGAISPVEFREMLSVLNLHYSDERYKRLFSRIDIAKTGELSIRDLNRVIFPDDAVTEDLQRRRDILSSYDQKKSIKATRTSIRSLVLSTIGTKNTQRVHTVCSPQGTPHNHSIKSSEEDSRGNIRKTSVSGARRASKSGGRHHTRRASQTPCVTKLGMSFRQHLNRSSSEVDTSSVDDEGRCGTLTLSFDSVRSPSHSTGGVQSIEISPVSKCTSRSSQESTFSRENNPAGENRKYSSSAVPYVICEEYLQDDGSDKDNMSAEYLHDSSADDNVERVENQLLRVSSSDSSGRVTGDNVVENLCFEN